MGDTSSVAACRDRVARAWASGGQPDLKNLLSELDRSDQAAWAAALTVDAEARAERNLGPTLEHYLGLFPWLAPGSEAVEALLAVEVTSAADLALVTEAALLIRYGEPFSKDIRFVLELVGDLALGPERPDPTPGTRLGKYELRSRLGQGTFGQVWLAWDHELACFIALKLIPPIGDLDRRMGSLMVEARAASGINHSNVVGVRAAGRFPEPDNWFYIDMQVCGDPAPTPEEPKAVAVGQSLPERVKDHRPDPREIARIMAEVCRGVVAAHAQGVVHCDLKPANVLITPSGRAMVADFGLSSSNFLPEVSDLTSLAADASVSVAIRTQSGHAIRGTPAYMSPEQARGEQAKPISDVYSLGAILFWLLAGKDPYQLPKGQTIAHLLEKIGREADPSPPLPRETHPSLTRMCKRAMQKLSQDRYQSAAAMQADLEAFLDRRVPPTVGSDSALQPLMLWTGRNALPVGIAAAGMLGLATLTGIAQHQRNQAQQQETQAKQQQAIAEAITKFQIDMLAMADPDNLLGDKVTVVQAIEAAVKALNAGSLADQPMVEAGVRDTIGTTLQGLARFDDAEPNLQKSLAIRRAALPREHPDIAVSLNSLALLFLDQNRLADAEPLFREALEIGRKAHPAKHPWIANALNNLASLLQDQNKLAEAEPLFREALEIYRAALPAGHPDTANSLNSLASLLEARNKLTEAEPLYRESLQIVRKARPPGHPQIADVLNNLALLLKKQNKLAEAEPLYREALDIARAAFPVGHPDVAIGLNNLAGFLRDKGQLPEAETLCREALAIRRAALPAGHPDIANSLSWLALLLQEQNKLAEAEPLYREALEIERATFPVGHPRIALSLSWLARLLRDQGQLAEAEALCREALAIRRAALPVGHPDIASSLSWLALLLQDQSRLAEAEPLFREALDIARAAFPAGHPSIANSLNNLAVLLQHQGELAEAEPLCRETLKILRDSLPAGHPDISGGLNNLAMLLLAQNNLAEAESLLREAVQIDHASFPAGHPSSLGTVSNLGSVLRAQGKHQEVFDLLLPAEPLARKAFTGGDVQRLAAFLTTLGRARVGLGYDAARIEAAEANLLEAHAILVKARGETQKDTLNCVHGLIDLYTAWDASEPGKGYDAKAAEWRVKPPASGNEVK